MSKEVELELELSKILSIHNAIVAIKPLGLSVTFLGGIQLAVNRDRIRPIAEQFQEAIKPSDDYSEYEQKLKEVGEDTEKLSSLNEKYATTIEKRQVQIAEAEKSLSTKMKIKLMMVSKDIFKGESQDAAEIGYALLPIIDLEAQS